MGRNLHDISSQQNMEIFSISNRFGGLDEDIILANLEQADIGWEVNKENINGSNLEGKGKGVFQAKGGPERDSKSKNRPWAREGFKDKPNGPNKGVGTSGLKPNQYKVHKPTRGLIFGPTRDGLELSQSGERLRVENESLGRLGGRFVSDTSGSSGTSVVVRDGEEIQLPLIPAQAVALMNGEGPAAGSPTGETVEDLREA